ncbi:hypothetical protein AVDCRST_MAG92-2402 [uncultured Coleofasciculus sp.]|uniref:Uncharacterized protein n=1 Tax=uncultured Coleofasciculus sp. TaxID=1267456 RepID=A0A6J4IRK4_9CYAN|nr:hypothetical protein AVDCRST_MAG92-2402 [uncultured Coleofasciculus sp.]
MLEASEAVLVGSFEAGGACVSVELLSPEFVPPILTPELRVNHQ